MPEEDRYQQRRELAEQTQALYEGFCDKIISNDGTPQETLRRLKESLL